MKKWNWSSLLIMTTTITLVSTAILLPGLETEAAPVNLPISNDLSRHNSAVTPEPGDDITAPPAPVSLPLIGLRSEIAMVPDLDNRGYAVVHIKINRIKTADTGETYALSDGIGAFDANVAYPAGKLKMTSITVFPPFEIGSVNLNARGGTMTFFNYWLGTLIGPVPPATLVDLRVRLEGTKDETTTAILNFRTIATVKGDHLPSASSATATFRRGDANNDGSVTIADALFINQYLAGNKAVGTTVSTINPVNAASVQHDDASGDKITISDALYLAQSLADLRDASFAAK